MKKIAAVLLSLLLLAGGTPALGEDLSEKELMSFYDNTVFVGDSITRQLHAYLKKQQKKDASYFSNIKFLAAQSLSLYRASRNSIAKSGVNLSYQGTEMPMCRILEKMKPARVVILLGLNDYIGEKIPQGIHYAERILELRDRYAPDTEILFLSLTPVTRSFSGRKNYQKMWDEYNEALEKLCLEKKTPYIDLATPLKDEDGFLNKQYSSDGKCHLNTKGLNIWIDVMLQYAQSQYDLGLWQPAGRAFSEKQ